MTVLEQLGMWDCHQGGVTVDREGDSPKGRCEIY